MTDATLFDLADPQGIDVVPLQNTPDALRPFLQERRPVLLSNIREALPFCSAWNYEFFRQRLTSIRMQRPEPDGVYHYLGFARVPISEFHAILESSRDAYALEPLMGRGVAQDFPDDLAMELPEFIPRDAFRVSNLYVGPGGNRSLLHYDETHSLLMMVEGRKRFILFPPDQSSMMYPYSVFNIKSIIEGRVIDSRVDCSRFSLERYPAMRNARGISGWLEEGQALLIPAGTWHYIEAEGLNVSVNYFWMENRLGDWLKPPLIHFWFKRRIIDMLDVARRIRQKVKRLKYARSAS